MIASRMDRARADAGISTWAEHDCVEIDHDVDAGFVRVRDILHAERMKRTRQAGPIPFARGWMGRGGATSENDRAKTLI